ncbi:hypothetical protein F441_14150 [Phytophthora nicotianae CJ01A1]|uniref:Uncharacterized protein n=5 Tax=Phytophthora nicotianae TaxID=4792 RepID=W2P9V8_PHYN3|nr:hypothetical protein PPTG_20384 [Phytophthora nicotianae INRA-310]ETI40316.1 hypothetical protein F443_14255 [Phytophthora nicotianae P1569]ETK80430.1 hypothetical protein L915_13896 [Phytophthora nicotianae]ETP10148.1 hypothetical protein F441_14150 [Phytophthora nicotianae CJ01A1]ETP38238.1 hypothetical protein F442_14095 [Phytophthora nicotianae P10297]ETL33856.1 hypothetical protein L916_13792 [Phytophthora nicotianae]
MPLAKWFRSNQRGSTEDGDIHPLVETGNAKTNTNSTAQRSIRSRSLGSSLRVTRDASAEEELQCTRCKSRRRFTIDGLTYRHKHGEDGWSCNDVARGSMLLEDSTTLTTQTHLGGFKLHFGRTQLMAIPFPPKTHPSIIFIDCPP